MYTTHFGFRENPFQVTPDPRFFYTNALYQEAYASLLYGVRERKGFVVLTGEAGTGKTALLHRLMHHLEVSIRFVFIAHPILDFDDLLSYVNKELGLQSQESGRVDHIRALRQFLIEQSQNGGNVVLLIDEAQNLSLSILENLRLLSNFETATQKLLQIVLVGQPELVTILDRPELRQLKQRVAIQRQIGRLKPREIRPYIEERMRTVGYEGREVFARETVARIAHYAQGIPRLINVICDNALLTAYATSQRHVSAAIIEEVAADLQLQGTSPEPRAELVAPQVVPDAWSYDEDEWEIRRAPRRPHRSSMMRIVLPLCLLLLLGGVATLYSQQAGQHLAHLRLAVVNFGRDLSAFVSSLRPVPPVPQPRTEAGHVPEPPPQPRAERRTAVEPAVQAAVMPGRVAETTEPAQEPRDTSAVPAEARLPATPALAADVTVSDAAQAQPAARATSESPPASEQDTHVQASEANASANRLVIAPQTWREQPYIIPAGVTVAEIVTLAYGRDLRRRTMALNLVKDANPHIRNLSRVQAGQKLWLPPINQETLLRIQPDDTLSITLGAYSGAQEAEELAQEVQRAGYTTRISATNVADTLILYRVEVIGLQTHEEARQVWSRALELRWFSFTEGLAWQGGGSHG